MAEIRSDPERLAYFLAIRQAVGEGHDQFVDDMFSSRNGRRLYVSRPSLADVIALNLRTRKIIWRTKVDGNRADHMAISPDGKHVLVSASTRRSSTCSTPDRSDRGAHPERRPAAREQLPKDGTRVYHASIGSVYTPLDEPASTARRASASSRSSTRTTGRC